MKRVTTIAVLWFGALAVSIGCSDKTTSTTKQAVQGPGGTTEIEHKETVKRTGDNPPSPQ